MFEVNPPGQFGKLSFHILARSRDALSAAQFEGVDERYLRSPGRRCTVLRRRVEGRRWPGQRCVRGLIKYSQQIQNARYSTDALNRIVAYNCTLSRERYATSVRRTRRLSLDAAAAAQYLPSERTVWNRLRGKFDTSEE